MLIPYDKEGNLFSNMPCRGEDITWRDNEPFEDTLIFSGFSYNSKAHFLNLEGKRFEMFLKDFEALIFADAIRGGSINGLFMVAKRGTAYGIRLLIVDFTKKGKKDDPA